MAYTENLITIQQQVSNHLLLFHLFSYTYQRFYTTCCIESELLYVKSLNNGLVEVTDKCCKKKA